MEMTKATKTHRDKHNFFSRPGIQKSEKIPVKNFCVQLKRKSSKHHRITAISFLILRCILYNFNLPWVHTEYVRYVDLTL